MSGPYGEHEHALSMVSAVRGLAEELDPKAVWMAFGTCRMESRGPGGVFERKSVWNRCPELKPNTLLTIGGA